MYFDSKLFNDLFVFFFVLAKGIPNTVDNEDHLTKLVFTIEKTLQKYNIDATACTQRTLCTSVRDAARNVANGIGTSSEKILDGITR